MRILTLIWVGFLGVCFEVGGGRNFTRGYARNVKFSADPYVVSENILFSAKCQGSLNFIDVSIFWQKIVPLLKAIV